MSHRPTFAPDVAARLYRAVAWVAQADGVSDEERTVLNRLRVALDIGAAATERLPSEPPASLEPEAQGALCCMIAQVVAADGKLSPEERVRVEGLAKRLNLDQARLDKAIMDRLMGAPRR